MKTRFFSTPAIACALIAIFWAALTLGPYMRETDEGWLLDGGMNVANGHSEITRTEFEYDKQFVSYWLPGPLFKCLPRPFQPDTLVLAGNALGMGLFWGALFWLTARSSRRLSLALALPIILAPTFLVYSPFYASAFTSVAFVLILAVVLDREKWNWPAYAAVFLLAFCAVGGRADAIFIMPLLAMLHSPRRTFLSVVKSPLTWLMASGGLTAFFLGRVIYHGVIADYCPMTFHLKIYLGYVAFGLGGGALVLLAAFHAVWSVRRANRSRVWLLFLGLGLAMPMGYYSFQLLTPRHCTVGAVGIFVFVCAKRGRAIFQTYLQPPIFATGMKTVFLAAAIVPMFVGLNVADLRHPRITCTHPTLLPTGAGVAPAGAYLAFAREVRRSHGFLDHNHAVWSAAKNTQFQADSDGRVDYCYTPLESYLTFAIRLQGKIPRHMVLDYGHWPAQFYIESRSLMRFQFVFPFDQAGMDSFFANTTLTPATTFDWHGITIFRADTNAPAGPDSVAAPLWPLNTIFGRDEFSLEPVVSLAQIPVDWAGKKIILVSRQPFDLDTQMPVKKQTLSSPANGVWYVCEITSARANETVGVPASLSEKVVLGVGIFPEWMSLQKL